MNDFLPAMFNRVTLLGSGGALVLIGVFVWNMPRLYRGTLALRQDYAARLRAAGEVEKAERVDAGTTVLLRRVPTYGRVLVAAGVASLVAGFLIRH